MVFLSDGFDRVVCKGKKGRFKSDKLKLQYSIINGGVKVYVTSRYKKKSGEFFPPSPSQTILNSERLCTLLPSRLRPKITALSYKYTLCMVHCFYTPAYLTTYVRLIPSAAACLFEICLTKAHAVLWEGHAMMNHACAALLGCCSSCFRWSSAPRSKWSVRCRWCIECLEKDWDFVAFMTGEGMTSRLGGNVT